MNAVITMTLSFCMLCAQEKGVKWDESKAVPETCSFCNKQCNVMIIHNIPVKNGYRLEAKGDDLLIHIDGPK